jgi:uncharacterized protein YjbJ (UPF0337 family)
VNNDRAQGKVHDVAGRVHRPGGEWTGGSSAQVKDTLKHAEGKAQMAWGKLKDLLKTFEENKRRAPIYDRSNIASGTSAAKPAALRRRAA